MRPKKNPKSPVGAAEGVATPSGCFDTIKQASVMTGVPAAVLTAAKHAGCPGFRHGRVHWSEVKPWLDANPIPSAAEGVPEDIHAARFQEVLEKVRKLKLVNDVRAGRLIEIDKVKAMHAGICANWNTLRSRIEAEWPIRFVGLQEPDAIREVIREMMTELGKGFRALGNKDT